MSISTLFSTRGLAALVAAVVLVAQPAQAQQQASQKEHVVRKRDTLWDLARTYFNDPFRWPIIFDANRNVVENPHWIYPAERLVIPGLPGDSVRAVEPAEPEPRDVVIEEAGPEPEEPEQTHTRFYKAASVAPGPTGPTTSIGTEAGRALTVQPAEYLSAPWVNEAESVPAVGRVIQSDDPRNTDDKLVQMFHPRDRLYIRTMAPVNPGDRLLVVRVARNLRGRGRVVEPQGVIVVETLGEGTALAIISHQFSNLRIGDFAIPMPAIPALPEAAARTAASGPQGRIIDFLVDQPIVGTAEYAFVDLGANSVNVGDELMAFLPPRSPEDAAGTLPAQPLARLVVVKTTASTATVRVTRLAHAALRDGLPVQVVARAR